MHAQSVRKTFVLYLVAMQDGPPEGASEKHLAGLQEALSREKQLSQNGFPLSRYPSPFVQIPERRGNLFLKIPYATFARQRGATEYRTRGSY